MKWIKLLDETIIRCNNEDIKINSLYNTLTISKGEISLKDRTVWYSAKNIYLNAKNIVLEWEENKKES